MAYDIFSEFYDELMYDADYDKMAEYSDGVFKSNGIDKGILLDLGCGTGNMSLRMSELGYDVIGVDKSTGMLSRALSKSAGRNILYLNQDMEALDLYGTVDCCICYLDCLNHLDSIESVKKAIENVALFMNHGGIFIFDVNTVYKHRNILADNTFVKESEDTFCVWQNSLNDDNSVTVTLDFFKEEDGLYSRCSEEFTEKAYPLEKLEKICNNSGFETIGIYDGYSSEKIKENTHRAVFVMKRG